MPIKTPKFWVKRNIISFALLPLSFIYFLAMLLDRYSKKSQKISKPVICIGNFIAGGSGKTPTAIAIGKILQESFAECKFAYLSIGYKGKGADFISLQEENYEAKNVGDEPLLLNEIAPTFISKNRLFGAKQIDKINEIKAVILDDGMQNKTLHQDLVIAVVDGKIAFGNEFLIPAGPMRQPLNMALKTVDFVVIIGETEEKVIKKLSDKKITRAKIVATNLEKFSGQKLIAFCGLAYPEKFFSFLEKNGLEIINKKSFSDHYFYQNQDLEKLCEMSKNKGAKLVTTKKDWIKFPDNFQKEIDYLDINLEFLDKEFIKNELKKVLSF